MSGATLWIAGAAVAGASIFAAYSTANTPSSAATTIDLSLSDDGAPCLINPASCAGQSTIVAETTTTEVELLFEDLHQISCSDIHEQTPELSEGGGDSTWFWGPTIHQGGGFTITVGETERFVLSKCAYTNDPERAVVMEGDIARKAHMPIYVGLFDPAEVTVGMLRTAAIESVEASQTSCAAADAGEERRCFAEVETDDSISRFAIEIRRGADYTDQETFVTVSETAWTEAIVFEDAGVAIVAVIWRSGGECPSTYFNEATGERVDNPDECFFPYTKPPSSLPMAQSVVDTVKVLIGEVAPDPFVRQRQQIEEQAEQG